MSSSRSVLVLAVVLALLTSAVYLPVSRNDFVNYDDPDYITSNAQVQNGLSLAGINWAFRTGHACNWHPVTWLSHMLDFQLFGLRAGPTHLVNAAFHTANAVLLFLLFASLTGLPWRSWFVAAFFALHPLHVESVAWAAERKDVLSTLFLLLTLALYRSYVRSATPRRRWGLYLLALVAYALGLMSKPMLITLPFVLLLLDYWPLRRFPVSGAARCPLTEPRAGCARPRAQHHTNWIGVVLATLLRPGAGAPRDTKLSPYGATSFWPLLLEKAPFFVLSICVSVVTFLVQKAGGALGTRYSFEDKAANAIVAYASYLLKTVWPLDLAVLYPHPDHWPLAAVLVSALGLAAVSVGVLLQRKRRPYLLVGWLWFLGTLIPVIGLVQVGLQSMADRYTYIPLIGIFFAGVWWLAELTSNSPRGPRSLAISAGVTALLLCAGFTVRQLGFWQNSETLFQHALRVTTNNFVAYNSLGYYYGTHGQAEQELDYYRRSLAANPDYSEALNNMGCALSTRGRASEAQPFLERALQQAPRNAEVHFNLANALWEQGQRDQAVQQYQKALELKPDHAEALDKLGLAAVLGGRYSSAITYFESAIKARADFAAARSHLGNIFALQQHWEDAVRQHSESVRLQPDNAMYQYNLANVLLQLGRNAEAVAHFREAVRLAPRDPEAALRLGIALTRQGERQEALKCFEQALRLKPGYTEAQRELQRLREQ